MGRRRDCDVLRSLSILRRDSGKGWLAEARLSPRRRQRILLMMHFERARVMAQADALHYADGAAAADDMMMG